MSVLLHITTWPRWLEAAAAGQYTAESLQREGFIHCSTADTVLKVANQHFRGEADLVLLCIAQAQVAAEVRYEGPYGGDYYPHIYGPLNCDAVFKVVEFPAGPDGRFVMPEITPEEPGSGRLFLGCVIRESLHQPAVVAGWAPFARRAIAMPDDPDASLWNVCWYRVAEADLQSRLPALAMAMRPHWYAHFWEGEDLCVILAGQVFWAKASERASWQAFIAYGESVGVERRWTERIPTVLPDWARAALR